VESDPDTWWQTAENHIGNGPFKVTGIDQDQRWTFAANDNYWQGRPLLDGIEYRYVDEVAVALEAYRAGDLDIVTLEATQIPEVQNDPELSQAFVSYPTAGTHYLGMNLTMEPFNDPKVREAFSYAIDRATLCTEVLAGTCTPTLSFMPPGTPGAIETDQFGFNPDAARQALAESSYGSAENLPEIKLYYNSDFDDRAQASEWLAGEIRDILGVEMVLEPTESATLVSLRNDRQTFPQLMYFGSWYQDFPDPQNWLSTIYSCESSQNNFSYCNEEFDRLTHEGDITSNQTERIQFYEQAGQILVDDVPTPFLYNPTGTFIVSPAVTGYTPAANEFMWPGVYGSLMTIDKAA
jgi:oligopeptide transport system substrate-binding protein